MNQQNNSRHTYTGSNRQQTPPELPKQIDRVNFFEPPKRWMLWLIVFNMGTWVVLIPTAIYSQAGDVQQTPKVLLFGIVLIPVYIIGLYISRIFLYLYWRYFWWVISCQFTCMTLTTIGLLIGIITGSFVLSNYVRF